jgi:hypothetical protein
MHVRAAGVEVWGLADCELSRLRVEGRATHVKGQSLSEKRLAEWLDC